MKLFMLISVYGFVNDLCYGCDAGKYFDNGVCKQCPSNCSSCLLGSECISCKAGFYGVSCSDLCPMYCHDQECEKQSGLCLSCINGYFSNDKGTCDKCPENCMTCYSKNVCFACKSRYKGTACEDECSSCKQGSSCDKNTGYCFENCKDGLSGEMCDLSCNSNCISCDRLNKNSCITCAPDRYGTACNETCPSTCLNSACSVSNGSCSKGCSAGYWGQMCENSCPWNCINCEIKNGTCLTCAEGYNGGNCSTVQNKELATNIMLSVVLVISGVILFVATSIVSAKLASRRCRRYHSKNSRTIANDNHIESTDSMKTDDKNTKLNILHNKRDHSPSCAKDKRTIGGIKLAEANEREKFLKDEESSHNEQEEVRAVISNENHDNSKKASNIYGEHSYTTNQTTHGGDNNENINANTIVYTDVVGYKTSTGRKYIASFGPLTALTKDGAFFTKVLEKGCSIILMLTYPAEYEKLNKQLTKDLKHGDIIIVSASDVRREASFIIRSIQLRDLKSEGGNNARTITLYVFHCRPQMWIPHTIWSLRDFLELVGELQMKPDEPIMVYCGDKVDLCGTCIAFDMLKRNPGQNDMKSCITHLKNSGVNMNKEETELLERLLFGV